MVRSVFFDFYTEESEQQLLRDLVAEVVHIFGTDCWYCPRTVENRDAIFSEAEFARFDSAFFFEFFVKSSSQMGGEGALLSKFGVELRDEMILTVPMETFKDEVTTDAPDIIRPREGDVIFIPMIGSLFTIKYVDKKAFFYQLGDLQAWDLTIELWEDQSAVFNTGVPLIDSIYQPRTEDILVLGITTEAGDLITDPSDNWVLVWQDDFGQKDTPLEQNIAFEQEATDNVIDWSESDPFSAGGKY